MSNGKNNGPHKWVNDWMREKIDVLNMNEYNIVIIVYFRFKRF